MKNHIILALLFTILLTSCSKNSNDIKKNHTVKEVDGIKVFHNKNIPSDPSYKIDAKKLFTIEGSDENCTDSLRNFSFIRSTVVDSKGNIFILDQNLAEIKKFSKNGIFLKSFCRLGSGPGEIQGGAALFCLNDTLFIQDITNQKYSKFTTDGKYIENFMPDMLSRFQFVTPIGTQYMITDALEFNESKDGSIFSFDLQIRNSNLKLIKSIGYNESKYNGPITNYHDFVHSFCVGKNNIYVAKNSSNEYSIDVYDFNGVQKYKIKKDYRKISMTESEISEYAISQRLTLGDRENREYKIYYKKAVDAMHMFEDNYGNLLVQVPIDRNEENMDDFVVDAFKNGVFLNRLKIDIGRGFDFYNSSQQRFFIGNRIYHQNREESSVTVFEY
ncbi:MAG: hypothetical protein PF638_10335 [Candidatus Delongbacteria bacterium]|jgi:hypothetical protein|nr:hypothetical protein [Candidatus Delongbacteria bacterium]